jgi:hypothetical protein
MSEVKRDIEAAIRETQNKLVIYSVGRAYVWVLNGEIFVGNSPPYLDAHGYVHESSLSYSNIQLNRVEAAALGAMLAAVASAGE